MGYQYEGHHRKHQSAIGIAGQRQHHHHQFDSPGAGIVKGLQAALKSVNDFYGGYDPGYTWWMPDSFKHLDSSLTAYGKLWQEKSKAAPGGKDDGSHIIGYPIGKEEIIRQLQLEYIPYTPEELIDIANKEFAWCDAEMLKASQEMGFGKDWKKALEKVKNTYVPPAKQPEAIMKLYNESVDFLKRITWLPFRRWRKKPGA